MIFWFPLHASRAARWWWPLGSLLLLTAQAAAALRGPAAEVPGSLLPPGSAQAILRVHNAERRAVGVDPLRWDGTLAATALDCTSRLVTSGTFQHCALGENLWIGATSRFSPAAMAELWAAERRDFHNGTFPQVSRTGNWTDMGHYSQMVWRQTTAVGCAAAAGADGLTRLVCHDSPPGNKDGQPVY